MLKKINNFINILMGGFIGAFVGGAIFRYHDYQQYKSLYDTSNSAPWYTSLIVAGIGLVVVLIICLIGKIIIRKKLNS